MYIKVLYVSHMKIPGNLAMHIAILSYWEVLVFNVFHPKSHEHSSHARQVASNVPQLSYMWLAIWF